MKWMAEPFFEVLEHSADIGFRAFADTREALFVHAALAMLSIAGDPLSAEPVQGFPLAVSSGDAESLMVDWLNEVLYWYDGKQVAFRDFRITELHDNSIEAIGIGEPRDPARHRAHLIVKAVTYHQLKVERRDGVWIAEVYLDI
jgi:SHS2 domain-containing protein